MRLQTPLKEMATSRSLSQVWVLFSEEKGEKVSIQFLTKKGIGSVFFSDAPNTYITSWEMPY